MSCCQQRCSGTTTFSEGNGTCGRSNSTVNIPTNAISAPIKCSLPCVQDFSTSVDRFKNQITRDVLSALSRRCQALAPPLPPGTLILLSDTTTIDQTLTSTIVLEIQGVAIDSVNITLRNVTFTIIGFSSVVVQVSGEAVITVVYQGIDGLTHTQTAVVPFVFTETIPGDFPPNVIVQGSLSLNNQLIVIDIDPSTLAITAVTVTLFFTTNIRILVPVA